MLKKILLFALAVVTASACTQTDIRSYVAENRVDIRTISPDSTDFSDLQAIGTAIGDSRVVMVGEQDHGDAPSFLAKTRLIKYLHEQKGFNVLAFENDFFALNEGWERLDKRNNNIRTFLSDNIFSVWSQCKEFENLVNYYIPHTYDIKKPLIISGFDNQVHGRYSATNLRIFINRYLQGKNINYTKTQKYKIDFLSFIDSIKYNKDLLKQKKFNEALEQISFELTITDTTSFEIMLLKSLKATTESEISFLRKGNDFLEIRDKQMAENLKWLLKYKFPNEKVIVWAHNAHILKHPELMKRSIGIKRNMGSYLVADQQLNKQTYFLGFNSRVGTSGRITNDKKFALEQPAKNGFESWIPESVPYAFVDFKQFRKENPSQKKYFLMKGVYHLTDSGLWTEIYDGIFYIRDMYPCGMADKTEIPIK